jgi:hypothetical protein
VADDVLVSAATLQRCYWRTPEIGPSGTEFVTCYRQRTGHKPSYPAAQAAAAGYLAHAAHQLHLTGHNVVHWGNLDPTW